MAPPVPGERGDLSDGIASSREHKILLRKPTRTVGREPQRHPPVIYRDVGVVVLLLGKIRDLGHQGYRFAETRTLVEARDLIAFDVPLRHGVEGCSQFFRFHSKSLDGTLCHYKWRLQ